MEHQLEDDVVQGFPEGIRAVCTCGWRSTASFTPPIALVKFTEHQSSEAGECIWCGAPKGQYCTRSSRVFIEGRCPRFRTPTND